MVILNFDQKDVFVSTTQTQNLGRLLSSVCREAQDVIRDLALKTEASEEDGLGASSNLVTNNIRQELWERVRVLRELYLKCIVLVTMNDDAQHIADLVQIGGSMWDVRETVRRRAQEFYEIQWPPMGNYPPPQPPWALDIAANVLVTKNPRTLPKYFQLAMEQAGSNSFVDAVKNIRLPLKTRKVVGRRLTSIIRAEYALALSKTEELQMRTLKFVQFRLEMGRVHLESPGEFHVTFFTDFRRYQFERYRVFVGGNSIVAPQLEIMGSNTLQSACNVVVETLDTLKKRALYEVNGWKALINASKETRQKSKDLRMLAKWLQATHSLSGTTTVPKALFEQILEKNLFEKVLSAGLEAEHPQIETVENIHNDEDDALFEGAYEDEKQAQEEHEVVAELEECGDLDKLTGDLYRSLWEMEKNCLMKLIEEREAYRSIEGNEFTFEFYRFVVLLAARISRYGSLLILRDQARNMTKCTAAPGGVIYVREWRQPPKYKRKGGEDEGLKSYSLAASSDPSAENLAAQATPAANDEENMVVGEPTVEVPPPPPPPPPTTKQADETQTKVGWKKLFDKYFIPPADTPPSLAEEYPETVDLIPFANLFPISALPVHTDVVEIDFLPGLPLSILTRLLGTEHEEKICKLKFALDQSQAELYVILEPLDTVVRSYLEIKDGPSAETLETAAEAASEAPVAEAEFDPADEALRLRQRDAVVSVMEVLLGLPELSFFYSKDLRRHGSSSVIAGFGGRYLNLTVWIAHSYQILSRLVLGAISQEVGTREDWRVVKLSDGIELIYKTYRSVKIFVNLLTGYIDIHPIMIRLAGRATGLDLTSETTDALVASLNEGDISKFLGILESIEKRLTASTGANDSRSVVHEEIVLDDDDHSPASVTGPLSKRTKTLD